jgi:hypothetical protein
MERPMNGAESLVRTLAAAGVTTGFVLEADIYPVKEWLGHTDPKTTERYAHMRPIPIARIFNPKAKGASNENTAT